MLLERAGNSAALGFACKAIAALGLMSHNSKGCAGTAAEAVQRNNTALRSTE